MASTYSTSLRIQLIGTGEQSGVWGSTTNANLGTIVEQAITGVQTISLSGSSYTLTSLNGISDQARNAAIIFTGTPSATCTVTTPAVNKIYIIFNNTSGGFGVTMTTGSGSTITVPNGSTYIIYCDGTNYYSASNYVSSNVSITGGTINGTTIGATTPSTGAFTTLSASSTLTAVSNVTVGGTLGVTGSTTLSGTLGVTGNATFSGTITGNLSGNATTATTATSATSAGAITNSGGWSVTPSGTNLYFNYNGTNVAKIDSSGNLTVKASVTSYGSV